MGRRRFAKPQAGGRGVGRGKNWRLPDAAKYSPSRVFSRNSTFRFALALTTFGTLWLRAQTAPAPPPAPPPAQPAQQPPTTAPITLDFPADGVELRTLAEIVSKRLKIPILYDET